MDFSEAFNTPWDVTIGSTTLTVARLSIGKLFGHMEALVRSDAIKSASDMAKGVDPEAAATFLTEAWKSLPKGEALLSEATDRISTMSGIVTIIHLGTVQAGKPISEERISDLVNPDNLKQLAPLVATLTGFGDEKKTGDPHGNPTAETVVPPTS